jgi:uncharacterized protein YukE/peptidoglycan hydrolase-like protein with peptidoglycan-binding domain
VTRILVHPEELHDLSGQMSRAAGELRAISARLMSALSTLDWESRLQVGMHGEAAAARSMAEDLAGQAEVIARYLNRKAHDFADADAAGVGDMDRVAGAIGGVMAATSSLGTLAWSGAWSTVERWLNLGRSAVGKLPRMLTDLSWLAPLVPGAKPVSPSLADEVCYREAPELVPPPVPPAGPGKDTRLPSNDEVRFMQRVFGIEEEGYGPRTKQAVADLQRQHGIPVDAAFMIGPATWGWVIKAYSDRYGVVQGGPPPAGGYAHSSAEFRPKLKALGPAMEQWADLIWKVSREWGVPAEVLAAVMMQESGGRAGAGADGDAGQGLMQIEFSAHKDEIPGDTDAEKRAWILKPENNVGFAVKILKQNLDEMTAKYGPGEGLRRALQYYNYGSGAGQWVENHCTGSGDWEQAVKEYSKLHGCGDPKYFSHVEQHLHAVLGAGGVTSTPDSALQATDVHPSAVPSQHAGHSVDSLGHAPVYDGSQPAQGTVDVEFSSTLDPALRNAPSDRSKENYDNVINQFAVEHNPRYTPRAIAKDGDEETFCNVFVRDVTHAMGVEIPAKNANQTAQWFAANGDKNGWHEVSAEMAQEMANEGDPVVAAWDSGTDEAGHVAVVRPGTYDSDRGPTIAQASVQEYMKNETDVVAGFGLKRKDQVKYYVHN